MSTLIIVGVLAMTIDIKVLSALKNGLNNLKRNKYGNT
jgi:hypothetical protein